MKKNASNQSGGSIGYPLSEYSDDWTPTGGFKPQGPGDLGYITSDELSWQTTDAY